jgi:hypothetical protein
MTDTFFLEQDYFLHTAMLLANNHCLFQEDVLQKDYHGYVCTGNLTVSYRWAS